MNEFTSQSQTYLQGNPVFSPASDSDPKKILTVGSMIGPSFNSSSKIAIIDDELMNIEVVQGYLELAGYENFQRTTDATQAFELIRTNSPDVVLLDVVMPNISGLDVLAELRMNRETRQIPVIILTASTGSETKLEALNLGATDFLAKPVDPSELVLRIRNVLSVKAHQDHLQHYSNTLEEQVELRTQEVVESRQRIIHCLARAAEYRDDDTGQHVMRVGKYAGIIANQLGFDAKHVELIEQAAQLHDIGKIGISDKILLKNGKLSRDEFDLVKDHCEIGTAIIDPLSTPESEEYQKHAEIGAKLLDMDGYPVMELAGIIAQTHHEKWDGSGYPRGLKGEEIPIEGRITAVADVFDALSNERPYKPAFPLKKCLGILMDGRGTHFDPNVLDAFLARIDDIVCIQNQLAE